MRKPTVHLNGSSEDELLCRLSTLVSALDDTLGAISGAWPNGRDYYPQGQSALAEADREWKARRDGIRQVKDEIVAIRDAVAFGEANYAD